MSDPEGTFPHHHGTLRNEVGGQRSKALLDLRNRKLWIPWPETTDSHGLVLSLFTEVRESMKFWHIHKSQQTHKACRSILIVFWQLEQFVEQNALLGKAEAGG